ncbi:MAG: hypothetical protein KC492_46065 [Myxococcales bacterium]|nr:hypothetical protein [Myxococcales bacterium]MCB9608301.1 hypothetical protein [Polyangiaceae bacterium]
MGTSPRLSEPTAFWKAHPELLPEHVVACTGESKGNVENLNVDFDPEPNAPVAEIIKRLEAAGWTRTEQKESAMGHDLQFRKDTKRIVVSTILGHKRTHAMFTWEELPGEQADP